MNENDEAKKVEGENSEVFNPDSDLKNEITEDKIENKSEEKNEDIDNNSEQNTLENSNVENSNLENSSDKNKSKEKSRANTTKKTSKKSEKITTDVKSSTKKEDGESKFNINHFIKQSVEAVFTVLACIVIAKMINSFIIVNARVPSASMETTIMTNDRLVANRLAYIFDDPETNDVIVFVAPDDPEKLFIKRVIGTPGDRVDILEGSLYVNGELVEEPYLKEEMVGSFGPYYVPEDSYFMLGDNRNNSLDARFWANTYVPEDTILGKAMFTYYPKIHVVR